MTLVWLGCGYLRQSTGNVCWANQNMVRKGDIYQPHPYSIGLQKGSTRLDGEDERLATIPGNSS